METYSENIKHAIENELMNTCSVYDDELIRNICSMLEDRHNKVKDIATLLGVPYSLVASIQNKKTHTDISDQYNIQSRKINNNLSIDEVHRLCQWFSDNPRNSSDIYDVYCKKALNALGYQEPSSRLIRTAKKIYTKETYGYISNYYNF